MKSGRLNVEAHGPPRLKVLNFTMVRSDVGVVCIPQVAIFRVARKTRQESLPLAWLASVAAIILCLDGLIFSSCMSIDPVYHQRSALQPESPCLSPDHSAGQNGAKIISTACSQLGSSLKDRVETRVRFALTGFPVRGFTLSRKKRSRLQNDPHR